MILKTLLLLLELVYMADLRNLKEYIESMSKHHQVEVLRILKSSSDTHLNENQNGTFVNLSLLTAEEIDALNDYSEYVKEQQKTLALIEAKKQVIANKYFKDYKYYNDNKDTILDT
jgi:small ligand-binding sensory domain FIST